MAVSEAVLVKVTVVVVVDWGMVYVDWVKPQQEQALEYLTAPEQALA